MKHAAATDKMQPLVSYDPGAGEWLVLQPQEVGGMPAYLVAAASQERAVAEQAAGLHDAPVRSWLLLDRMLGWYRLGNWSWNLQRAHRFPDRRAAGRQHASLHPFVDLFVCREFGLVTCPDLPAAKLKSD